MEVREPPPEIIPRPDDHAIASLRATCEASRAELISLPRPFVLGLLIRLEVAEAKQQCRATAS